MVSKTDRIINQTKQQHNVRVAGIAGSGDEILVLPNHSGIKNHIETKNFLDSNYVKINQANPQNVINGRITFDEGGNFGGELSLDSYSFGDDLNRTLNVYTEIATDGLTMECKTSGASGGTIDWFHNSTSPAQNDEIGRFRFIGNDADGDQRIYAQMRANVEDPNGTTPNGSMKFQLQDEGNLNVYMTLDARDNVKMTHFDFPVGMIDRDAYFISKRYSDGNGNHVYIEAGDGNGTDKNGGDINLNTGTATGSGTAGKVYVNGFELGQSTSAYALYDAIVDAAGNGDYTSIATALSTEGTGKSIFVKRGTYSESANPTILANQIVFFDDVTINLSAGNYFIISGNDATLIGNLAISGNGIQGGAGAGALVFITGDRVNGKGCDILATATDTTPQDDFKVIWLNNVENSYFNFRVSAYSFTGAGGGVGTIGFLLGGTSIKNEISVTIEAMNDAKGVSPSPVIGVNLAGGAVTQNIIKAIVAACTTTTGNVGTGVLIASGNNYNCIIGSSRGSDLANLTNSGTGNVVGSLAV